MQLFYCFSVLLPEVRGVLGSLKGEADEVEADAHTGTGSGTDTHSGDEDIKDGEGGSGGETDYNNLLNLEGVLGDGISG